MSDSGNEDWRGSLVKHNRRNEVGYDGFFTYADKGVDLEKEIRSRKGIFVDVGGPSRNTDPFGFELNDIKPIHSLNMQKTVYPNRTETTDIVARGEQMPFENESVGFILGRDFILIH